MPPPGSLDGDEAPKGSAARPASAGGAAAAGAASPRPSALAGGGLAGVSHARHPRLNARTSAVPSAAPGGEPAGGSPSGLLKLPGAGGDPPGGLSPKVPGRSVGFVVDESKDHDKPAAAAKSNTLMPPGAAAGAAAGGHSKFQQVARSSMLGVRTTTALGTSFFLEKQAVVIDFGGLCTKVGFATESRPRHIVPTPQLRVAPPPGRGVTSGPSEEQWVEILDRLLSQIYFHYLSVNPKERRVVICDPVNSSVQFRHALTFVLFKRLSVPSVAFVCDLTLPLYLTGLSTGIVVDVGFESTRLLATFAGVPVISAFSTARGGGRLIGARLRRRLLSELPAGAPSQEWLDNPWELQDLVARTCYVACDISAQGDDDEDPVTLRLKTDKPAVYATSGGATVTVPALARWQAAEVLFREDAADADAGEEGPGDSALPPVAEEDADSGDFSNCASVPEAFAQLLERCPIDVRAAGVQNIVICGGCAALRGLLPRLADEMQAELRRRPSTRSLAGRLRFTPLDFHPTCAVWTGGAVWGSMEGSRDYTAKEYAEDEPLPDWARDGFI